MTKLALITGASRGLGRSTALALAQRGVDVIGTYHSNRDAADATAGAIRELGRRAVMLRLDTGSVASFASFTTEVTRNLHETFERGDIDYLVNNAGMGMYVPFAQTTEAQFDALMNVHFKGVFFLTQALLPLIVDGGRIVNVSSGLARFTLPGSATYASMKGAVEVLSRYLAKELGPRRIAVNAVAPGACATTRRSTPPSRRTPRWVAPASPRTSAPRSRRCSATRCAG